MAQRRSTKTEIRSEMQSRRLNVKDFRAVITRKMRQGLAGLVGLVGFS